MTAGTKAALLPAGLVDVLPPLAAFEARAVEQLIATFASYGYDRIKPPLLEFEETLLAGPGAALAGDTFRLMDPLSQRMLAMRSDMTTQVARIASSRLAHWPRPLRLSYAGQVVRVRGSQLRTERQFGQVGAELFGAATPWADVEMVLMATSALAALGVGRLSVDLGLPTLVPSILTARGIDTSETLQAALHRKDVTAILALAPTLGVQTAELLARLVETAGPAETALPALSALDLPAAAAAERASLIALHEGLQADAPELSLTVDAAESRGFEYHSGVIFSLFSADSPTELGRGGRYCSEAGEPATGVTLFMDAVLRVLERPQRQQRVLLPVGTSPDAAADLRTQGWVAVAALDDSVDAIAEARRLECSHVFNNGVLQPLTDDLSVNIREAG